MTRAITLTGMRVGGDLETPIVGAGCAAQGGEELLYDDESHCVFPATRYENGCSAEGFVLATLKGDDDPSHVYCVPREAVDAGLATPVDHYPRLLNIGISAAAGAIVGLLATLGSKSGKIKTVGMASGAGVALMILAMTWPKSKLA